MKLIQKARVLALKTHVKHEIRKQLKKQYYQIFLQQNTQHLPNYQKLKKIRRTFLITSTLCLTVMAVQTVFFYNTIWTPPTPLYYDTQPTLEQILQSFLNVIPTVFGALFLIFSGFGMAVDWVIHRRWQGKYKTILHWQQ